VIAVRFAAPLSEEFSSDGAADQEGMPAAGSDAVEDATPEVHEESLRLKRLSGEMPLTRATTREGTCCLLPRILQVAKAGRGDAAALVKPQTKKRNILSFQPCQAD
jgi:hypothetical protein